jgi:hypothetical protein
MSGGYAVFGTAGGRFVSVAPDQPPSYVGEEK